MEPTIQDAVHDVSNALSFLPSWAVGVIVLALAAIASLVVHALVAHLVRRALARRPGGLSLLIRARPLTQLAFVTIALALVLPVVDLSPRVADWFAVALPF